MAMKKSNITRPMVVMIVALVAAFALSVGSASATTSSEVQAVTAANGACGGGSSLSQMIRGWKKHGVLDDVARSAGQTPGLDGSSRSIVKGGIVKTIVVKGGWVKNYTCKGGKFKKVGRKYISTGSTYWVPEKLAPAPCSKKHTKLGYEARCGNKQVGNLLVKRPCNRKSKPKLPPLITTPPPPGPDCVVIVNGDNNGNAGCGNVQICTANGNYNGNPTVCSAYQSCVAIQGNTWNSTQNVCTSSPPPPPPTCPDGRPVPSNGACDRPPNGEVVASAAHMQTSNDPTAPAASKHVELYFEGSDPDGDALALDILLTAPAGTYVSGKRPVSYRYDLSPCPASKTCWQATLNSGTGTGTTYVSGKFTAGGKYFVTDPVQITVAADTYPLN